MDSDDEDLYAVEEPRPDSGSKQETPLSKEQENDAMDENKEEGEQEEADDALDSDSDSV